MSFRAKLAVASVAVFGLCLIGFYLWLDYKAEIFVTDLVRSQSFQKLNLLSRFLDLESSRLDDNVDQLSEQTDFRITITDSQARVIADSLFSGAQLQAVGSYSDRPEIAEALERGEASSLRYSTVTAEYLYYLARRLPGGYVLRVATSMDRYDPFQSSLRANLLFTVFVSLLLGTALLWVICSRPVRSIGRLSDAALRIAGGEFLTEIAVDSKDELGTLARQMEQMSSRLEEQLLLIESERNHVTAILKSMSEGVLVTDLEGRIVGTNPSLLEMFALEANPTGKRPLEVIRNTEVHEGIQLVLKESRSRESEVRIADKTLLARFALIGTAGNPEGVVVVFHDISELRRLESLQKEFTSNVSHELKTPLTSIQGYAETLLEEEALGPVHRSFAEKIYRNSSHLSEMIEELFRLARLERVHPKLSLSLINFTQMMHEIKNEFSQELAKKNLDFQVENKTGSEMFLGSELYIRRVFTNLVENAVKYTDRGRVEVLMERTDGGEYQFRVRDTGIGIPEEDIGRIFGRFYRVDKDRSRKSGGTGIGLAIVKHIVQLHKGRVWAESCLDEGTSIFFTLPQGAIDDLPGSRTVQLETAE